MVINFSNIGGGGGGSYTLPIASATQLGGVKVGENLSIDSNGVLSAESGGESNYVIVDSLDEITEPYEGLKAWVNGESGALGKEYIYYTTWGWIQKNMVLNLNTAIPEQVKSYLKNAPADVIVKNGLALNADGRARIVTGCNPDEGGYYSYVDSRYYYGFDFRGSNGGIRKVEGFRLAKNDDIKTYTAGEGINIDSNNVISATGEETYYLDTMTTEEKVALWQKLSGHTADNLNITIIKGNGENQDRCISYAQGSSGEIYFTFIGRQNASYWFLQNNGNLSRHNSFDLSRIPNINFWTIGGGKAITYNKNDGKWYNTNGSEFNPTGEFIDYGWANGGIMDYTFREDHINDHIKPSLWLNVIESGETVANAYINPIFSRKAITNPTDNYRYIMTFDYGKYVINVENNDSFFRNFTITERTSGGGTQYEAGANITISGNTISAVDTTYTAGTGIDITNNVISTSGVVQSSTLTNIVKLTQAAYDALETKDPNTLYVIVEEE